MSYELAQAAKLLAEPARAAMMLRLMSGKALPAGELANAANVTPQTASEHLARLAEGGFVTAHQQGRHRYYGLAASEVADVVESLLVLTASARKSVRGQSSVPAFGTLEHARTCYAHIAGWLGVALADAMQHEGYLGPAAQRAFLVTDAGSQFFSKQLGIAMPPQSIAADPKFARQCIDWTERRPHLAGKLGVAMHKRFLALGWIGPAQQSRVLRVTLEGRQALQKHLHIAVG